MKITVEKKLTAGDCRKCPSGSREMNRTATHPYLYGTASASSTVQIADTCDEKQGMLMDFHWGKDSGQKHVTMSDELLKRDTCRHLDCWHAVEENGETTAG